MFCCVGMSFDGDLPFSTHTRVSFRVTGPESRATRHGERQRADIRFLRGLLGVATHRFEAHAPVDSCNRSLKVLSLALTSRREATARTHEPNADAIAMRSFSAISPDSSLRTCSATIVSSWAPTAMKATVRAYFAHAGSQLNSRESVTISRSADANQSA